MSGRQQMFPRFRLLPLSRASSVVPERIRTNTHDAVLIPAHRSVIQARRSFSPFRSPLMKSQTGRPGGTCSASAAKTEADLRTNWQHPCFQCNCTYLASHLRGSFRRSGLIEQCVAEWRRERSQAEQIFGPLRRSQNFPGVWHVRSHGTLSISLP